MKNSEDQYKPNDLIPKCQRFVLHMKKLYEENTFSKVVAMDETPLFADNMGKTTLSSKGAKEVKMTTTGNGKKFQTLVLSINLDGSKNKPCIIFKGKGRVSEAQELQNRDNILVLF